MPPEPSRLAAVQLIPLWLKITYSGFLAVMIPVYWMNYGPTNFLYFCDVALLLTLVGIWRENSLLISLKSDGRWRTPGGSLFGSWDGSLRATSLDPKQEQAIPPFRQSVRVLFLVGNSRRISAPYGNKLKKMLGFFC